MPVTYDRIASTTIGSPSTTIDFTGIPNTYTDLVISGYVGATTESGFLRIRYNGSTDSNYSNLTWYSSYTGAFPGTPLTGSGAYGNLNWQYIQVNTAPPPTLGSGFNIDIQNYKSTSIFKTSIIKYNNKKEVNMSACLWRSTDAINQVTIDIISGGSMLTGSNITIYGILAA